MNLNNPKQMPPDTDFNIAVPQISNEKEKVERSAFDLRNYLDFTIPEGQTSKEVTIRLLPINPETQELFQIIHLHNINVHKDLKPNKSGKKAYMCLNSKNTGVNHDVYGSNCPICEAQSKLWEEWHEEKNEAKKKELIKEIASLNIREYCIVRCIERGNEKDGPKFWRIPLRQDKTDAYHKILLLGETRRKEGKEAGMDVNIFSIYNGRDLIITFTEGTGAPTVVDKGISTPLTKDENQLIEWYYDDKKWSDVFSTKPYDYLKIAFEGQVPWYDRTNSCWLSKEQFDNLKSAQEDLINDNINKLENQFKLSQTEQTEQTPLITTEKPLFNPNTIDLSTTTGVNKTPTVMVTNVYNSDDDELPF